MNFSAAHEIDNSTDGGLSLTDGEVFAVGDVNQTSLKSSDDIKTMIDVESDTDFDAVGEYFKIKLSDGDGNALKNEKVTFAILKKTYTKTTDSKGIASLQLNLNDGIYDITAKFAGNANYKASSLKTTVTINNTRVVDEGLSNSQIQKIIDNAKDRNVILFKAKSYSDINLVITKRLALISDAGTVLKSSSKNPVIQVKGKSASYTVIDGFTIRSKADGITVSGSDFVRIINNDIATSANAVTASGTKYINITGNTLEKNSKSAIVLVDSVSAYIFDNVITKNGADAVEIAKSDRVYIHANTIKNNEKNGIVLTTSVNGENYVQGPKNVYITKNIISNNLGDGILIKNAGDNINVKSNDIGANHGNGISVSRIGSNTIQSNDIFKNWENGIKFFDNYVKPENQEISYNAIHSNLHMDVEAKDTYYQDTGTRLQLGENWYTDFAGICPKIRSGNLKFSVTQIGPKQFQATFRDSNGDVASLLPDRTLTYTTADGKTLSVTISGGAGVFTVDADDGDLVRATVDNSKRDNTYSADSKQSQPVNGVTPSYEYPAIPYDENGNGNGAGEGSGNGNAKGGNDNAGNGTHSQEAQPASNAADPVSDASLNYETADVSSQGASAGSSGDAGNAQSRSVVKQIIIDEDDVVRVTGISFIVLLIILTITFYYRDEIKEMNSKR